MEPNQALMSYLRDVLGLSLPEVIVLPRAEYESLGLGGTVPDAQRDDALVERLTEHPAELIDGFVTDTLLVQIAERIQKRTLSTLAGSINSNNKLHLHRHLESIGLPVFDTRVAESFQAVYRSVRKFLSMGYTHVVIKSPIGASGIGMIKVDSPERLNGSIPPYLADEGVCLVQGWMDESIPGVRMIGSPSVQLFIGSDAVDIYDVTEQILSQDSVHEGNIAPPPYLNEYPDALDMLINQATEAAIWLQAQGYRGTASVDFLLLEREKKADATICEINARVTGATYPSVLARHFLPSGAWLMRNLLFERSVAGIEILDALDRSGYLWRPGNMSGVLPINFNTTDASLICKGQFLCLASGVDECQALFREIVAILPVGSRHDRD
jgi:hypothetical protein